MSCGFEADGANESIKIVDDALIEAIELGSLWLIDLVICADGAEKAGDKRRIDAFDQFQEDKADRVSLRP